jgi:hypothetical protein
MNVSKDAQLSGILAAWKETQRMLIAIYGSDEQIPFDVFEDFASPFRRLAGGIAID